MLLDKLIKSTYSRNLVMHIYNIVKFRCSILIFIIVIFQYNSAYHHSYSISFINERFQKNLIIIL